MYFIRRQNPTSTSCHGRQARRMRYQPRFETLEDRTVPAGTPVFHFLSATFEAQASSLVAQITVVLDNPPQNTVGIDYSAVSSTTKQPPAAPNVNFIPTSGKLAFTGGAVEPPSLKQTFNVTLLNPAPPPGQFINPVYYVDLALKNPSAGTKLGSPSTALLKIDTTGPSNITITPLPVHAAGQMAFYASPLATFTDEVQNLVASSYQAMVNWGDGTPATPAQVVANGSKFNINALHTFPYEGTFTYKVTVTPAHGSPVSASNVSTVGGFITGLYRDVLGIKANNAGLKAWQNLIYAGNSRQAVAYMFWNAPAHQTLIVQQLYQTFLGRLPSQSAWASAVNYLLQGGSAANIIVGLVTSAEYAASHPTNISFVNGVYTGVVGMGPTNSILATFTSALNNQVLSRSQATLAILGLTQTYQVAITQYYIVFYGRQPDPIGFQFWLNQLLAGGVSPATIASQFLGSQEYLNRQIALALA